MTPRPLADVFACHDVAVAYLFGSQVEGSARPDSDHDFAVLFARDQEIALDATVRLGAELARALGTAVDVVDLNSASLELRGKIANAGQPVYSHDEAARVRFEVDARMRWIEFRPVVEETTAAYLRRVAVQGLR